MAHVWRNIVRIPAVAVLLLVGTTLAAVAVPASAASRASAPSSATAPRTDACGPRPARAGGGLWSCTFVDDFSGGSLDRTKWVPQQSDFASGAPDAYACYRDDPANVRVGGGVLSLTVLRVSRPVDCGMHSTPTSYVSGMVSTWHLFSQERGRFEARVRNTATTAPGLQEVFWLWPDERYPDAYVASGEIDVSETYSLYDGLSIPFLHHAGLPPVPGVNTAWDCEAPRGQWNTYTLEWTATRISIYVNGTLCLSNGLLATAFKAPAIIGLTQGLGEGGNSLTAATPIPATMDVDYVRVWD